MTQEVIDQLKAKNQELEKQLHGHKQAIDGLNAQLDANKQMLNEALNTSFQVRTQLIMTDRMYKDAANKNAELTKQVANSDDQLTRAVARIKELEAPEEDNVKQIANGKKGK